VAEKNPKGLREERLGLGELVGRIKNHGPTRSHVNPRPPLAHESNQNSTILLVNASPKIPNPKSVPPERKKEKRNKERINSNFSSLQTGYHRRTTGNLETWQIWDVYHGMHHIGSSLLPSGLVNTLDPSSPHMTKVTRFIVFLVF
jgi:hypothetical protein